MCAKISHFQFDETKQHARKVTSHERGRSPHSPQSQSHERRQSRSAKAHPSRADHAMLHRLTHETLNIGHNRNHGRESGIWTRTDRVKKFAFADAHERLDPMTRNRFKDGTNGLDLLKSCRKRMSPRVGFLARRAASQYPAQTQQILRSYCRQSRSPLCFHQFVAPFLRKPNHFLKRVWIVARKVESLLRIR